MPEPTTDTTPASTAASTEAASTAASAASGTDAAAAAAAAAATGEAKAGDTAAAGAPAETKYDLKVPDGSTVDADFVTRTAATARALGLNNEAGQKLLDAQIAELTKSTSAAADAAKADQLKAMQPGGAIWTEQEAKWRADSLADAELGGSPEKLKANVELAGRVVKHFSSEAAAKFFEDSGLGSHPEMLRMLTRIGRSMSEATLAPPSASGGAATTAEDRLARLYTTMAPKS